MNSARWMRMLPLVALLVAAMSAFAPGCGSDDGPNDSTGGSGGAGGGAGGSGGSGGGEPATCTGNEDCEPTEECNGGICTPKQTCEADADCPGDRICVDGLCEKPCRVDSECGFVHPHYCDTNEASPTFGRCIEGESCNITANCGRDESFDYCDDGDCICVHVENPAPNREGVCRRRTPTCSPCTSNEDCGNNAVVFDDPADCIEFNYDGEEVPVCLPRRRGACPGGTIMPSAEQIAENPALDGHCIPATNNCADFQPCGSDEDCEDNPAAPVCDLVRRICIPGCRFDYDKGETTDCAPGNVCHAKGTWLNPALLADCATAHYFGQGKCDVPCTTDTDCSAYDGGTGTFGCFQERSGEMRCRPKAAEFPSVPSCLDDRECPDAGDERYLGFCDAQTNPMENTCVYDVCRAGNDPRAGCGADIDFEDCSIDYKCVEDPTTPGYGTCEEKTCLDWGGANAGCLAGQFCAGEPMIDPMSLEPTGSPLPPPTGVLPGECYNMDVGNWCVPCNDHAQCATGPTDSANPGLCINGMCSFGCDYDAQCPGRWSCSSDGLQASCGYHANAPGEGLQICETDADCGTGNKCVVPKVRGADYNSFGGRFAAFKVCECSATNSCTGDFTCNQGVATASINPEDEATYGVRTARYCVANNDVCGPGGSCEWFGHSSPLDPMDPDSPVFAVFVCAGTKPEFPFPGAGQPQVNVTCPEGTMTGTSRADQTQCVFSRVCWPFLVTPPGGGDPVCDVQQPMN